MKKSIRFILLIAASFLFFLGLSSFNLLRPTSVAYQSPVAKPAFISIFGTSETVLPDGSTYTGDVTLTGAINAKGTFVMPTTVMGMALHCSFVLSLPNGTISIRMNCNLVTFNGEWQITGATGIYSNIKGGGYLVMPNDLDEVLTGTITGM